MGITQSEVILKARDITGNQIENREGEGFVPDEAIIVELQPTIRRISQKFGDSSVLKEVRLSITAFQQDYAFSAIAADVKEVRDVLRADAHFDPGLIISPVGTRNDPYNITSLGQTAVIPAGLQDDTFADILAQRRFRRAEQYSWETFGTTLRLYPPPQTNELVVVVKYLSTGGTIEDIPEQCEMLLVYAAVIALIDGELNRLNRTRVVTRNYGEADAERTKFLQKQVLRYQEKYNQEWSDLR